MHSMSDRPAGRLFLRTIGLVACTMACAPSAPGTPPLPEPAAAEATSTPPPTPGTLRVTFLGTGAPRPSFLRYGPTTLIEAGSQRLLVDPSWGLTRRVMEAGSFDLLTGIDHVLLTHLHYDHTIGLPELWLGGWLYGRPGPLRVQGPVGTADMVNHLRQAFTWDVDYRLLVGVPEGGQLVDAHDIEPGIVYERDGLTVRAFDVEHMPIDLTTRERLDFAGQTLGYRIEYAGRSLVLSGDTRSSDVLVEHAQNVDVLVHEVQVPSPGATEEAKLANVSLSVHTEPSQVAEIFSRTRPRMAVYSHIIPPDVTAEQLTAATPYDGPLTVAHDLMMITIGDAITVADRPRAAGEAFEASSVLK